MEFMTSMSHILLAASAFFAVAAAVLFFALDISKCWRMVHGKAVAYQKKPEKRKRGHAETGYVQNMETVLLYENTGEESQRTQLLGTEELEMIQDIVYMEDIVE